MRKPLFHAGMMVRAGDADAMVAGVAHPTARVIEADERMDSAGEVLTPLDEASLRRALDAGGYAGAEVQQMTGDAWAEDPGCYLSDEEIGV